MGPEGSLLHSQVLCAYFVPRYVFTLRSWQHLAQPPTWRTTLCWQSSTVFSIYAQLPSTFATWGCALPWWQGPTYRAVKMYTFIKLSNTWATAGYFSIISKKLSALISTNTSPAYQLASLIVRSELPPNTDNATTAGRIQRYVRQFINYARFEVFGNVTLWRSVNSCRRFGGP